MSLQYFWKKSFPLTTALVSAVVTLGCGSLTQLAADAEKGAASPTPAATAATESTNGSDASQTGTLTLTEPTSGDATVAKIRISIIEQDSCKRPHAKGGHNGPPNEKGDRPEQRHGHRGPPPNGKTPPAPSDGAAPPPPPPADGSPPPSPPADEESVALNPTTDSGCYTKDIEEDYSAGKDLSVEAIPVGKYKIIMALEDSNGKPIEQGSADVEIKTDETATADITLSPADVKATGSVKINIKTETPAKLAWSTPPWGLTSDKCIPVFVVLVDSSDRPALATTALSVTVNSSAVTGAFFSDSSCDTATTTVNLAVFHWFATVYYKDSTAGSATLTATDAAGSVTTASKAVTVKSRPAY